MLSLQTNEIVIFAIVIILLLFYLVSTITKDYKDLKNSNKIITNRKNKKESDKQIEKKQDISKEVIDTNKEEPQEQINNTVKPVEGYMSSEVLLELIKNRLYNTDKIIPDEDKIYISDKEIVIFKDGHKRTVFKIRDNLKYSYDLEIQYQDKKYNYSVNADSFPLVYKKFFKWYWTSDTPSYELPLSNGFDIIIKNNIKSISYRKNELNKPSKV